MERSRLQVAESISIPLSEIDIRAVCSQGAGGQNVNKVATAVHLRFDIAASSLPAELKERLLELKDRRITREGVIVIKAQKERSQEQNRVDALRRLQDLVFLGPHGGGASAGRHAPHPGSEKRRLESKSRQGKLKAWRRRVGGADADE